HFMIPTFSNLRSYRGLSPVPRHPQASAGADRWIPVTSTGMTPSCRVGPTPLGLGRPGGRLPKVAAEAARRVDVLDAEHHSHRLADLEGVGVDVGEVDHHPAALLELDH